MGLRVKFDIEPEFVRPKLDDLEVETIDFQARVNAPDAVSLDTRLPRTSTGRAPEGQTGGYDWFAWEINLSLEDIDKVVEGAEKLFQTLDKITPILVAILKIIRLFTSDLKSIARLLKVIVKKIIALVKELIDSLASTGVYKSVIFPDFDPQQSKFSMPVDGGFKEFVRTVNERLLTSQDPDAPRFGDSDTVGGVIFAMVGGSNDPEFLKDMVNNFRVLSRFFRFQPPMFARPKNVKAVPGFYKDENNNRRVGVRITWEPPDTPVFGYTLYRSRTPKGAAYAFETEGRRIVKKRFEDESFAGGNPVSFRRKVGKPEYEYLDFEVEDGSLYYYKVYSADLDFLNEYEDLQALDSPLASQVVFATVRECLPVSLLKNCLLLDKAGNTVTEDNGDWQVLTVRSLLGKEINQLFVLLDILTEKMLGAIDTASDAGSKYLEFFQKKIKLYIDITDKIGEVIERLLELRFRGTFMVLKLPAQKGGMQGFADRFNAASSVGNVDRLEGKGASEVQGGVANYVEKGIMFGVILLFGIPSPDGAFFKEMVPPGIAKEFEDKLTKGDAAIKSFLKILGLG